MPDDAFWMEKALLLANRADQLGEVPVGAVLVADGELLGEGFNQPISSHDPTAHAEVMAIRDAARKACNYRLPGSTLYITIEPCTMCTGAIIHARIARVVFGAPEPRAGALVSNLGLHRHAAYNHHFDVTAGVLEEPCKNLIAGFFRARRK